jgi:parvulin-like peptidyl-prolyl isomerase
MKTILLVLIINSSISLYAQNSFKALNSINNIEDAIKYRNEHEETSEIRSYLTQNDTSSELYTLINLKVGDTISINDWTYKILESKRVNIYRASYIYLDGSAFPINTIDSARKIIIDNYNNGESFNSLVEKYNMDGNGGDLGWFAEEWMVSDFTKTVAKHKKGEIFKVDVPSKKWYYITLKTEDNKTSDLIEVFRIKNGS